MRPIENGAKPQLPADVRKIFTDAVTAFPRDFAKQAQQIVAAHRPAGLPKNFQPLNMSLSDWDRIQRERERQRLDAQARAREQQRQAELRAQQGRGRASAEQVQGEQREREARAKGEQSWQKLDQEVRNYPNQFDQLAKRIADTLRQRSPSAPISVTPLHEAYVGLNEDGTVGEDYSEAGMKVSYSFTYTAVDYQEITGGEPPDYRSFSRTVEQTEFVKFGIKYSYSWGDILPEARASISDEALRKGVKVYFAYNTASPITYGGTYIPTGYPGALNIFLEQLYNHAESFSSQVVHLVPAPTQSAQPEPRHQRKGFWRRFFGGA